MVLRKKTLIKKNFSGVKLNWFIESVETNSDCDWYWHFESFYFFGDAGIGVSGWSYCLTIHKDLLVVVNLDDFQSTTRKMGFQWGSQFILKRSAFFIRKYGKVLVSIFQYS